MYNDDFKNKDDAGRNPEGPKADPGDWREMRREWRCQRREARYRHPLHGLFAGLLLVLLGVLFWFHQAGWLTGDNWGGYLLMGIGGIAVISGIAHLWYPDHNYRIFSRFIWGAFLILAGVLVITGFSQWWPLLLVAAGVCLLGRVIFRRGQIANR
jgi:hypothetical protein